MISRVKTILKFTNREDALKFHLLAISTEEGLFLSESEINVIVEIYCTGYNKKMFESCVEKRYFKSEQTVRNCITKLTKMGILKKSRGYRKVDPKLLPDLNDSDVVFSYDVVYSNFKLINDNKELQGSI